MEKCETKMYLFKILKRYLKDNGKYPDFVSWFKKNKRCYQLSEDQTLYDCIKSFDNITALYSYFTGQNEYCNNFSIYLTKSLISVDESMEIFKKFLTDNYGKDVYKNYMQNISNKFIDENTLRRITIEEEGGIRKLPIGGYLYYAFHWEETGQGHDYWDKINNKWIREWEEILMEYYINKQGQ